jgi:hypothetical protein
MMLAKLAIPLAAVAACLVLSSQALAQPASSNVPPSVERELLRLRAEVNAQGEARTRQADAFDAAATRIEIVNGALVLVVALVSVVTGFVGVRWVRSFAEKQVSERVDAGIAATGQAVFEAEARSLRDEYDAKFAEQYRRYSDLVERD